MQAKIRHNYIKYGLVFLVLVTISLLALMACGGAFDKANAVPTADEHPSEAVQAVASLADYPYPRAKHC